MNKAQKKFQSCIYTALLSLFIIFIALNTYFTVYNEEYNQSGVEYVVYVIFLFGATGFGVMSYLSWQEYLEY